MVNETKKANLETNDYDPTYPLFKSSLHPPTTLPCFKPSDKTVI